MTDIIIVGGGLAGLNTARLILEKSDYNVILIDKGTTSKNNPLRLTFKDIIENYNLTDCIRAEYNAFGILSYHGARIMHRFEDNRFVALDYQKSCTKYLDNVKDHKNFEYISDRAIDVKINEDYAKVTLKNNSPIQAKLIIDASGSRHFALKLLDVEDPKLYSHSFGQSFKNCSNENINEAWFIGSSADYGSGGGWYYPTSNNTASVGFAVITESSKFPASLIRQKFFKAVKEIYPINKYLKSAKAVNLEAGTIPIDHISRFSAERLLITGDAAGQATPWMCMGIEPILHNSDLVAEIVIKALNDGDFSTSNLANYDKAWRKNNLDQFNIIKKMNPKIWFAGDAVWDFIIEQDIGSLTSQQFYERVRYNKHLMSGWTSLFKWGQFRLKHIKDWTKYKN